MDRYNFPVFEKPKEKKNKHNHPEKEQWTRDEEKLFPSARQVYACFERSTTFSDKKAHRNIYKPNIELNKGGNESLRVLGGIGHNALRQSQQIRSL